MSAVANISISRQRQNRLVQEVMDGKYMVDRLHNAAYEMVEKRQADYFSYTRNNMRSDEAHHLMYDYCQSDDLKILEALGWIK